MTKVETRVDKVLKGLQDVEENLVDLSNNLSEKVPQVNVQVAQRVQSIRDLVEDAIIETEDLEDYLALHADDEVPEVEPEPQPVDADGNPIPTPDAPQVEAPTEEKAE